MTNQRACCAHGTCGGVTSAAPFTRAHFLANLMAASLASVPELQKNALSAKDCSTSFFASFT